MFKMAHSANRFHDLLPGFLNVIHHPGSAIGLQLLWLLRAHSRESKEQRSGNILAITTLAVYRAPS
jgi:hypothetical protein